MAKQNTIRILGHNLSPKKKLYIALTCIYGVGIQTSLKILNKLNINNNSKLADLTETNISQLRDLLEGDELLLEGNLRRFIKKNITRLISIKCFKGKRHLKGLPVRGQRTRTNSKTSRRFAKKN
jgi:small subunit ribosomal protein S13